MEGPRNNPRGDTADHPVTKVVEDAAAAMADTEGAAGDATTEGTRVMQISLIAVCNDYLCRSPRRRSYSRSRSRSRSRDRDRRRKSYSRSKSRSKSRSRSRTPRDGHNGRRQRIVLIFVYRRDKIMSIFQICSKSSSFEIFLFGHILTMFIVISTVQAYLFTDAIGNEVL